GMTGTYTTTAYGGTCQLAFKLAKDQIEIVTKEGDSAACGFGNRVMADGTYKKISDEVNFQAK
ncbi:MAG: hypothetical protein AAF705_16085, partial [Bacteroidota bacterium]